MCIAFSLDLGSTNFKLATINSKYKLSLIKSIPAPCLSGEGLIRQGDPREYLEAANSLLHEIATAQIKEAPIALACQRSSFLLWEKSNGHPVTPIISWQDRRAAAWCERKKEHSAEIIQRTGLPLSPHYIGPKLASLFENNPDLRFKANRNQLLFGTLETWLIWIWTEGEVFETDLTMAARSLLVDLLIGDWSTDLLDFFGVPRSILPKITRTEDKKIVLRSQQSITATVADQAASLLSVNLHHSESILVNLGTGGFVIRPTGIRPVRKQGYLTGPIIKSKSEETYFAMEGTINGIASAFAKFSSKIPLLTEMDPAPQCFCSPETAGVGSPYWRPHSSLSFSKPTDNINVEMKTRVLLEGIIFRIYQIINDVKEDRSKPEIIMSGGLSENEFIYKGLSACLCYPVKKAIEKEATLLGAASLALPGNSLPHPKLQTIEPETQGKYLKSKFPYWEKWFKTIAITG